MYYSAISRITWLPTYLRLQCQYNRTFLRTDSRLISCNFGVATCFVNESQTHFDMDGTVTRSVGMKRLRNACSSKSTRAWHAGFLRRPALSLICHQVRTICSSQWKHKKEEITVNFLNRDGETFTVKGKVGETLLDTVIDNDVDIDGFGACEGTLACSTCHLIFDEDIFETLPEKLDEEEDMLDLAYGLEDTSRLGCQICLTKEMDGMVVRVPEGISDARDV